MVRSNETGKTRRSFANPGLPPANPLKGNLVGGEGEISLLRNADNSALSICRSVTRYFKYRVSVVSATCRGTLSQMSGSVRSVRSKKAKCTS